VRKTKKSSKSNRKSKQEKGFNVGISNKNTPREYLVVYRDIYESIILMFWEYRLKIREESTLKLKGKVMQGGRGGTRGELGCVLIMRIKCIK
jgi:hypothetical protein